MSKKKRQHVAKSGPLVIDSRLVWQTRKPRYNGFACGYGKHGDAKYNRAKAKNAWRKDFGTEGSQEGPFFLAQVACPLLLFTLACMPLRCSLTLQNHQVLRLYQRNRRYPVRTCFYWMGGPQSMV